MSTTKTRIGAWIADPAANVLMQGERSLRLEPRAMDVLMHLAARAGEVTSLDQIMAAVWKNVVVSDGSVYLAISQLREALGNTESGKSYIETVPKRGYRLVVPVSPVVPVAPTSPLVSVDSASAEPAATPATPATALPSSRRSWKGLPAAAALIGILLAAVIVMRWNTSPAERELERSLAVLPFADLSPDADQAYFADGITEEVLNRLATLRDLRVIARTSSFQLRGQGSDARAVGEKLGVNHLLLGSVRKDGDRVRVTAQLVDARNSHQVWMNTYERQLADIFAVQDDIAKAVSSAMEVKLRVGELARLPGMTDDVEAYDEYLRGMALNLVARRESFAPAIAHLQRAIEIDPQFSLAWAGLSGVYSNGAFALPERAAEWHAAALDALERARQLTPDSPPVLLGLGIMAVRRGDWLGAAPLYDRHEKIVIEQGMTGRSAAPRGIFYLCVGRIREAISALESARAHDPLAPAYAGFLSLAYLANGDFRSALGEVDRGLELEGLREGLLDAGLNIALATRDRTEIDRRLAAITDDVLAAKIHRRMGNFLDDPAGAAAEIRAAADSATDPEKVALSVWAAYYNETESALDILAGVIARRSHPAVIWHPLFADVRKLHGFETLVDTLGMTAYWRVHGYGDFCKPAGERVACH